jgi:hypothetical protein
VANAYYAEFGGDPAPVAQQTIFPNDQTGTAGKGNPGFAWHDMIIDKIGTNFTWYLDGLKIAGGNVGATVMSSNIFVGYYDPTAGSSPIPDLAFAIVDNLRVLTLQRPNITSIQAISSGTQVQIDFAASPVDTINSFTLQSAASVGGPYTDVSATFSLVGPGSLRAVRATSGAEQFYRLRR